MPAIKSYPDLQEICSIFGFTSCPMTEEEYNLAKSRGVSHFYNLACDCASFPEVSFEELLISQLKVEGKIPCA